MTSAEYIIAGIMFLIAGVLMITGVRSFLQRGFVLNNGYIYASVEERKKMDKKPFYRQTAIVFWLLSAAFIIIGLSVILQNYMIELLLIPLIAGTVIYAIASSIRISKNNKNSKYPKGR